MTHNSGAEHVAQREREQRAAYFRSFVGFSHCDFLELLQRGLAGCCVFDAVLPHAVSLPFPGLALPQLDPTLAATTDPQYIHPASSLRLHLFPTTTQSLSP